jgi:pyruvate/2-oxoglutarate dehydrogenase complex dihydrolipoamide acyltransferase (E2) component
MEVTFVRWLHEDGDLVVEGEPLFEVNTEKVVLEVQAFASGRLTDLMAQAGDLIEPHQVVARIVLDGAG